MMSVNHLIEEIKNEPPSLSPLVHSTRTLHAYYNKYLITLNAHLQKYPILISTVTDF